MTAIITNTHHCWILTQPDSTDVSDFEPHYDTEERALKAVEVYSGNGTSYIPKRLDAVCSIAIAACGYVYDEDGEGQEHWDSAEELHAHLLTVDWRDLPGGRMHCSADPGECEECDALLPPLAIQELPGQLDLLGGGTR